ncbi:hypothetical protein HQ590_13070 [bacterium]|nr:hypothetical protein [bacterium]
MKPWGMLFLSVILVAACAKRPQIYRAKVKLLLIKPPGQTESPAQPTPGDDVHFVADQINDLLGSVLIRRVQLRMHKTPQEVASNLTDLKVTPQGKSGVLVVTVDSPSQEFARDFANGLADEYMKHLEEQRFQHGTNAVQELMQDAVRLRQELQETEGQLAAFDKKHGISTNAALSELKALYENRERLQGLHRVALAKLTEAYEAQYRTAREVHLLEPATVQPLPTRPRLFR